nr:MAG TPA: Translation initiation factor IF-2, N-terminal region [Bacteriophage sp.]
MEGLNSILKELAKLLGVSNDALKGTLDTIGANYKEVYSTLAREYAIRDVVNKLWWASVIGLILFCVMTMFYMMEKEDFKTNKFLTIGITICLVTLVLTLFGPIFYPNINLIMGLLNK